MRRRLLNLLTALSLLLCAAVVALWYSGDIFYFGNRPQWSVSGQWGTVTVVRDATYVLEISTSWLLSLGLALPMTRTVRSWSGRLAASRLGGWDTNKGLCPHCGYDLRATPERCPECGNTP